MNKNIKLIIGALAILVVAAGAIGYITGKNAGVTAGEKKGRESLLKEQEELKNKITAQADVQPMKNLPQRNPFETIETNPFEAGYQNPFK